MPSSMTQTSFPLNLAEDPVTGLLDYSIAARPRRSYSERLRRLRQHLLLPPYAVHP